MLAWESGFGYVVDASEVRPDGEVVARVAAYLCKPEGDVTHGDLCAAAVSVMDPAALYTAGVKTGMAANASRIAVAFRELGATPVRPYRHSDGWPGGSLARAEDELRAQRVRERAEAVKDEPAGWVCWMEHSLRAKAATRSEQLRGLESNGTVKEQPHTSVARRVA